MWHIWDPSGQHILVVVMISWGWGRTNEHLLIISNLQDEKVPSMMSGQINSALNIPLIITQTIIVIIIII